MSLHELATLSRCELMAYHSVADVAIDAEVGCQGPCGTPSSFKCLVVARGSDKP
jgi:hypothetical protein